MYVNHMSITVWN